MEIAQEFTVDHDIAKVWESFKDVRLIATCVPGAEVISVSDDQTEVQGRIRVRIGPVAANFNGAAKIFRDDATRAGSVEGSGLDQSNGSRVAIKLKYALKAAGDGRGTTSAIIADIALSGLLAQFGKTGLINSVATQMTRDFANRLQGALNAPHDSNDPSKKQSVQSDIELNAIGLLGQILKRWVAGLFSRSNSINS